MAEVQLVSTAAWACIEFLLFFFRLCFFAPFRLVSTAAWACIEFLLALSFYKWYELRESQQPLGLALSFYEQEHEKILNIALNVSTAAWACIEFLLGTADYLPNGQKMSQQPLGLALSFYLASEVRRFLRLSGRLNSRLGLH